MDIRLQIDRTAYFKDLLMYSYKLKIMFSLLDTMLHVFIETRPRLLE